MRGAPPVARVASAFLIGGAATPFLPLSPTVLLLAAALVLLGLWLRPSTGAPAGSVAALVAGAAWVGATPPDPRAACLAHVPDQARLELRGYFRTVSLAGATTLRVSSGLGPGCEADIVAFVRTAPRPAEAQGVSVVGRWVRRDDHRAPGFLSVGSVELASVDVPTRIKALAAVRARVIGAVNTRFGDRAPVAAALFLADRSGVESSLRDAFVRSGTAHLLSISGFHIGVVLGLLVLAVRSAGLGPRHRGVAVFVGLWGYIALIGFPTAAVRAALMATGALVGRLLGRPTSAVGGLASAGLLIVIVTPNVATGPGFQLTMAGTLGIFVLGPPLRRRLETSVFRPLAATLAAGVAATLSTAPILALHFGQVSLVSLPATLVLGPIVAACVPGIIATVTLDLLAVPGTGLIAAGTDSGLLLLRELAELLGSVPHSVLFVGPFDVLGGVVGVVVAGQCLPVLWRRRSLTLVVVSVASCIAGVWSVRAAVFAAGLGRVRIVAVDVGQGDALLVGTPRGRWVLIDAGPRSGGFDAGRDRVVPYLQGMGIDRLSAVVLTHPDMDHVGGLVSVLDEVPVGVVLGPGRTTGQDGHREALAVAERRAIPWRRVEKGDAWSMDGVDFRVLHPGAGHIDEPNEWSVVLHVRFGEFDALFTGDASTEVERGIVPELTGVALEVLKVGHHGSRTSTGPELLSSVRPRVALISVGRGNRYGHPAESVMRRLRAAGVTSHRTDQEGSITVVGRRDGSAAVRGR